jgi:hypothetical protein
VGQFKDFLVQPDHILIAMVAVVIALVLGGKNLGELLNKLFKKTGDVTVNVPIPNGVVPEKCPVIAAGGLMVNPEQCVAHKAEHERSKRNEAAIEALQANLHETRRALFGKLDAIDTNVTEVKVAVAGLVVKTGQLDSPKRR